MHVVFNEPNHLSPKKNDEDEEIDIINSPKKINIKESWTNKKKWH